MKSDKGGDPRKVLTDLSALEEAFSGVRRMGEPPRKVAAAVGIAPPPAPRAPAPPAAPAPLVPAAVVAPARPQLDDAALLREAMQGVRRLDGANPRPNAKAASHAPVARAPAPPSAASPAPASPAILALRALADSLAQQLAAAQARILELEDRLSAEVAAHEAAVAARDAAAPEECAPANVGARSLRDLAAERGLLSDDELVVALRAVFEAHRAAALFDELVAREGSGLEQFFGERLVLLADGEAAPPGRVGVVVPAERSEVREDGPIRKALSLFSTACLIQGKRRIVFVGGSPAYRRQLRDGLDRRLDVRFVEGDQRRIPRAEGADLVIVWGGTELDHTVSAHFPDAIVIQHRGIIRMLELAAARIAR